jgi:hypothetical protein
VKPTIDNEPLRREAQRAVGQWATWNGLAHDMGWLRRASQGNRIHGDGTRLKRALGIMPNRGVIQKTIGLENAEKAMRALNLDPVDVGL